MTEKTWKPLYHEMLIDLAFRLHLADDAFCNAARHLARASENTGWRVRRAGSRAVAEYSARLRMVSADAVKLIQFTPPRFPAIPAVWCWYEPDGLSESITALERLHVTALAIEQRVNRELLTIEASS